MTIVAQFSIIHISLDLSVHYNFHNRLEKYEISSRNNDSQETQSKVNSHSGGLYEETVCFKTRSVWHRSAENIMVKRAD